MSDGTKKGGWFSRLRKSADEPPAVDALPVPAPVPKKESLLERFKREIKEQSESSSPAQAPVPPEPVPAPQLKPQPKPLPKIEPAVEAELSQDEPTADQAEETTKPKLGWMARLRSGLTRSSSALTSSISGIFVSRKLDDATLEELEDALIMADLGVETSARMVQSIAKGRFGKEVTEQEIKSALADEIAGVLTPVAQTLPRRNELKPQVILVAGVNGVGKTTTIGKLAKQQMLAGRRVMMAACDTFRAAAVEQLEIWGERNGCPVMKAKTGADPAGLAFDALTRAQAEGFDVLLIDTAGRLQNKQGLMDELAKIVRVIKKVDPTAPHDTLLVLDATTGQNTHAQVGVFGDMIDVSGLIVTKLDGTARGGVVVALAERFGLPVYAVGVGEGIDDLKPFEARAFARGLLGLEMVDVA